MPARSRFALLLPVAVALLAPHAQAKPVDPRTWRPSRTLLSKLGSEHRFGPYAMRLPVGFTVISPGQPSPGVQASSFQITGPARKDHTFPCFFVFLGSAPPDANTPTVATILDDNKLLSDKPALTKTDKQLGHTAFLQLDRQYFKWRFLPPSANQEHGFQYAASDGQTYVLVMAFDSQPYYAQSLPLLEASVLTLRKVH